ncbi:MAG: succinic semialdehyde dehydrogenase, partial [Bacteroidota bacterium]
LITSAGDVHEEHLIRAPGSGTPLFRLPYGRSEDVTLAVDSARRAQRVWQERSVKDRARIIERFGDIVWRRRDDLLDILQLETGKSRLDALEEVSDVLLNIQYYVPAALALLAPSRKRPAVPLLTRVDVHHRPVGVVGAILAWNYPLTLTISDALPALLAGNAVVLKPARETTLTALLGKLLLHEAGLPPDLFQVVPGTGPDVGTALIDAVDFLQFTGSTAVGKDVAARAAGRLIRSSMELGGKNPMIVCDDAPLERAVSGIIKGCFSNAGQLCIAFERLYVQRGIYDDLMTQLLERIRQIRLSADTEFGADFEMGSLISKKQLDAVRSHVEDARSKGARVLTGGRHRPDIGPLFYEPTVLEGVTPESLAYREETFGPVVSVYPFDSDEEAVRLANDSTYGLNASVWSSDIERARRIATRIECGTVSINEAYAAMWSAIDAPMGGMKESGMGRRHSDEGLLKYTEPQSVITQRFHPVAPPAGLSLRVYARIIGTFVRARRLLPGH